MHLEDLVAHSRAAKSHRTDVGSGKLKRRPERSELRDSTTQTVADDHDAIRSAAFGHLEDHLHHATVISWRGLQMSISRRVAVKTANVQPDQHPHLAKVHLWVRVADHGS